MAAFKQRAFSVRAWSAGIEAPVAPAQPTAFENEVARLGLSESQYVKSSELRSWCRAHRDSRYIPEWLLKKYAFPIYWEAK